MGLIHIYYKFKNFYKGLSNRALGVIILLIIFLFGYGFYWYLFSYNLSDIKIISNVGNYKINLKSDKYNKTYFFECPNKECILKNISPFNYKVEVFKDNYEKYITNFDVKNKKVLNINLGKKIYLRPLEDIKQDKLSREEKINLIKLKNKYFFYKKFENNLFILKDLKDKLELTYNNKSIGILGKVKKNEVFLDKVLNTNNYYFLKLKNNNYLINIEFLSLDKIKLNLDIIYIKKINNNFLLITTDKGSFLYNLKNKEISYFNNLYDFVILDNYKYLGILKDTIIQQKQNLGLGDIPGDLLVIYDIKNKNIKLLKKFNIKVKKIYKKQENIILIDFDNNKYELINLFE